MWRFLTFIILLTLAASAQNQTKKWNCGNKAAIDFMGGPPRAVFNSSMVAVEGCATISDNNGNLLFYTNGVNIWNQNHLFMANGTGLAGDVSTSQAALIVKKPLSSTLYYVFTLDQAGGPNGLQYSIVDMSLAAGSGSVISKNNFLYSPSTEKLCGVKHCNNTDFWILSHEDQNNVFRAYLLDAQGLSAVPVTSSVGTALSTSTNQTLGTMKTAPNGKKLGYCVGYYPGGFAELFDFDNSTGLVSNPTIIFTSSISCYGAEFSPNSTKFYISLLPWAFSNTMTTFSLCQFDLCAPNISSSAKLITSTVPVYGLQLGPDGKIYAGNAYKKYLGAFLNPDLPFPACNYVDSVISIAPRGPAYCLPNFTSSDFRQPAPVGFSLTCQSASFTAVKLPTMATSCGGINNPVNVISWDFGDPGSGSQNNNSQLLNPTHNFSGTGTYTVKAIRQYQCYSDTVKQIINVSSAPPSFSVNGVRNICRGESITLSGSNPACTYSWSSLGTGPAIVISPSLGLSFNVIATDNSTGCSSNKMVTIQVSPCLGIANYEYDVKLFVQPNPVSDNFQIETNLQELSIEIRDITGRIVKSFPQTLDSYNIADLAPGLYYLYCHGAGKSATVRILKFAE